MRYVFLSCLVAGGLAGPTAPGRADTEADAILAKAIKAHGGEEALSKYPAVRVKLRITEERTRFAYNHEWLFAAPDRYKDTGDAYYLGRKTVSVYATDGKVAWSFVEGRTEELEDKFAAGYMEEAHLMQVMRLVPLKDKVYELKAVGETKVDGETAVGLLVQTRGRKDVTLYFDADSGLLVKVERTVDDGGAEGIKEERFYQKYPEKDPLPYARKVVVKQRGKTAESYEVREVKFLESADEKEFRHK
jgi:hypothetical protein